MRVICPHCKCVAAFSAETEIPDRCPECGQSLMEILDRPQRAELSSSPAMRGFAQTVAVIGLIAGSISGCGGCLYATTPYEENLLAGPIGGAFIVLGVIVVILSTILLLLADQCRRPPAPPSPPRK